MIELSRMCESERYTACPDERSWRTRCMARRKRDVSDLPYTASPLSCVAFFVKEQKQGFVVYAS